MSQTSRGAAYNITYSGKMLIETYYISKISANQIYNVLVLFWKYIYYCSDERKVFYLLIYIRQHLLGNSYIKSYSVDNIVTSIKKSVEYLQCVL